MIIFILDNLFNKFKIKFIADLKYVLNKYFVRKLRWVFWKSVFVAIKLIVLFLIGVIPWFLIILYIIYKIAYFYKNYVTLLFDFNFFETDENFNIDENLYLVYYFFDAYDNNYDLFIEEEDYEPEDYEFIDDFDEVGITIKKIQYRGGIA